jgi:hypothetical protein
VDFDQIPPSRTAHSTEVDGQQCYTTPEQQHAAHGCNCNAAQHLAAANSAFDVSSSRMVRHPSLFIPMTQNMTITKLLLSLMLGIRVVHGSHFRAIFGSFSASFSGHFLVFGREWTENEI